MKLKGLPSTSLMILSLLFVTNCGNKDEEASELSVKNQKTVEISVNDPQKYIANTQNNNKVQFTSSTLNSEASYYINSKVVFKKLPKKANKLKTEQRKSAKSFSKDVNQKLKNKNTITKYKIQKNKDIVKIIPFSGPKGIEISLREKSGDFEFLGFKDVQGKELKEYYQLIHYSRLQDDSAFSLLFSIKSKNKNEDEKSLLAIYFSLDSIEVKKEKTLEKYHYMFGNGEKVTWPESNVIELSLCSDETSNQYLDKSLVDKAVSKWQNSLGEEPEILTKTLKTYPPFSDLNTHCIYFVDDFRATLGVSHGYDTYSVADTQKRELIDSDIFVYTDELKKFKQEKNIISLNDEIYYNKVLKDMIHEIGHFLGLDHNFKEKTIMNYDKDRKSELTDYDQEAINELYSH